MSCYILSKDDLAKISEIICTAIKGQNRAFPPNDMLPEALREYIDFAYERIDVQKVYERIFKMNTSAFQLRYPDKKIPVPGEYNCLNFVKPLNKNPAIQTQYADIIEPWHYESVRLLNCYLYQCCEGNIPTWPLYRGIQELSNCFLRYMITQLPQYIEATEKEAK